MFFLTLFYIYAILLKILRRVGNAAFCPQVSAEYACMHAVVHEQACIVTPKIALTAFFQTVQTKRLHCFLFSGR